MQFLEELLNATSGGIPERIPKITFDGSPGEIIELQEELPKELPEIVLLDRF